MEIVKSIDHLQSMYAQMCDAQDKGKILAEKEALIQALRERNEGLEREVQCLNAAIESKLKAEKMNELKEDVSKRKKDDFERLKQHASELEK